MRSYLLAFLTCGLFLGSSMISMTAYAKCGINSISTRRCEKGGWKTVVQCHDRVERTMGEPDACISTRRYSVSRAVVRGFCGNRCSPAILDCSEEPSFESLTRTICERIVICRPDLFTGPYTCVEGVECTLFSNQVRDCLIRLNDISASDELGLAESSGEITFAVMREALADGTIRFDNAVYCDCIYRMRGPSGGGGPFPSCPAISGPSPEPFGEGLVEELIPEQCGNNQYPGVFSPEGFNPVTGVVED